MDKTHLPCTYSVIQNIKDEFFMSGHSNDCTKAENCILLCNGDGESFTFFSHVLAN